MMLIILKYKKKKYLEKHKNCLINIFDWADPILPIKILNWSSKQTKPNKNQNLYLRPMKFQKSQSPPDSLWFLEALKADLFFFDLFGYLLIWALKGVHCSEPLKDISVNQVIQFNGLVD